MSNNILKEVILKNDKHLIVRKPLEEDAEKMIQYLNTVGGESDNLLFGRDEFRLNVEQEREYIKNMSTAPNSLMIIGVVDGNIVSVAQISSSNRKRIAHNAEVAISVKKEHWHTGIGSIMMGELIRFAKEESSIKSISLGVKASNKNAMKMYEKFGFERIGIHKNFFNVNGTFDDEILMDLYL